MTEIGERVVMASGDYKGQVGTVVDTDPIDGSIVVDFDGAFWPYRPGFTQRCWPDDLDTATGKERHDG